jgi:hypothetical protein
MNILQYTTAGSFSSGYHYIDAQDNPPSSCNVNLGRDCADGCVVSAIANYVGRTQLAPSRIFITAVW